MHTTRSTITTALLAATLAGGAGLAATALAQDAPAPPSEATTITVSPAPALAPGDASPFSVPGVRAIRAGKPIPAGYRLVGYTVATTKAGPPAGAQLRFTCPSPTTLRSFAVRGHAGFSADDRDYPGKRRTFVSSTRSGSGTGSVYAVCR